MDWNPPITTHERDLLNPPKYHTCFLRGLRHDWRQCKLHFAWWVLNSTVRTLLKGTVTQKTEVNYRITNARMQKIILFCLFFPSRKVESLALQHIFGFVVNKPSNFNLVWLEVPIKRPHWFGSSQSTWQLLQFRLQTFISSVYWQWR